MAKGRKGKFEQWLTEDGLLCVEGWARDGLTEGQIAHNMGISEQTLNVWKNRFPEIVESLKKGKAPVDFKVENALLKRALGYTYEEVVREIRELPDGQVEKHTKKTTKIVLPDVTAQIFWLKNRRPDKWRDKIEQVDTTAYEKMDSILDEIKNNALQQETD